MLNFKALCCTSILLSYSKGKFGEGAEVYKENVFRSHRRALRNIDLKQNETPPGTIGPAEEILNRYGVNGSICTGLVVGKHGKLSSMFLHICDLIPSSQARVLFNSRQTAVRD
jgi:hypothetical protein